MLMCENFRKAMVYKLESISKACGVLIAAALVLSTAATNILFIAAPLLNFAAGDWKRKFKQIIYNPVAIISLLFYSLFLVGILYSTAPWSDMLLVLRKYDKFFLAVFLFPLFTEEKWRNYAINAYLVAILIALIASYLRVYDWLPFGATNGFVEVFRPSIEFNFLMAFASYLILIKIASIQRYRWVWLIFLLLVVHTILFRSVGRSGYCVFACLFSLFFIQKLGFRGVILAVMSLVLILGLSYKFSPVFKMRSADAMSDVRTYQQNNEDTSIGARISFVKNGIALIKAHPFFGTGTGSFFHSYKSIQPTPSVITANPHNEYIYIGVQFGALGLMILFLLFGLPLWYSEVLAVEFKYIVVGVVFGIAVGSLANSWLLDSTTGHFYAYFLAVIFAGFPTNKVWFNKILD